MEVSGQLHAPAALPSGIHWIGGWVGLRVGLDAGVTRGIVASGNVKYLSKICTYIVMKIWRQTSPGKMTRQR
jgi:hypothetical protein